MFDKPVVQYVVEEALGAGVSNVLIITGRGKRAIEDHFDKSPELEIFLEKTGKRELLEEIKRIGSLANIIYIRQKEQLGLGHAILQAKDFVGNDYFSVLLGDTITRPNCLKEMIEIHEKYGASVIALQKVPMEEVVRYGIVELGDHVKKDLFYIKDLVEKPKVEEAPSEYAIVGRYILSNEIFGILENVEPGYGGEIQLTDAIRDLINKEKVIGYIYQGRVYDIGNKLDWLKSTIEIALESEYCEKILDFLKTVVK